MVDSLFGPRSLAEDRASSESCGVDDEVADAFAVPSVGHVDLAVIGLDHGGIGEFAFVGLFDDGSGLPRFAVVADGKVDHLASPGEVIVKEEVSSVFESESFDAGVVVGERGFFEWSPGEAAVFGEVLHDGFMSRSIESLDRAVGVSQERGLDDLKFLFLRFDPFPAVVFESFEVKAPVVVMFG